MISDKATPTKKLNILYAFQGTGNGHSSRVIALYPALKEDRHSYEFLISGNKSQLVFPFEPKRLSGIVLHYGKSGGVSWMKTLFRNSWGRFLVDIWRLDLSGYDAVINDFEPVSAWKARILRKPIISLSHQVAVIHPQAPKPKRQNLGARVFMQWFAPAAHAIGFHFAAFDKTVLPPLLTAPLPTEHQKQSRNKCLVYLPAYAPAEIQRVLTHFPKCHFTVFHPDVTASFFARNVLFLPVDKKRFNDVFQLASRVICGAGFELPAEALAAGKMLLAIPIKHQYEQYCNAAAIAELPNATVKTAFSVSAIEKWMQQPLPAKPPLLKTTAPKEVLSKVHLLLEEIC